MPASIIETNPGEFQDVEVDPVTLDIIESGLRNARWEMDAVLLRTAVSPGIREQGDEFPMIANRKGLMVVGQFGSFIPPFIEVYEGDVEEGDMFLTSDPYSCAAAISHANDWLTMHPVYYEGRHVAWIAMFGHMTDVGGAVPGSLPTQARQIYEEGILIPPVKVYKRGERQDDLLNLIFHQVRQPHLNRADLDGMFASVRTAERRILDMCDRFGVDTYVKAVDMLLERNRRAMEQLIVTSVAEEKIYFEDYVCDDGLGMGPYKIACTLWREGNKAIFDFEGTDPQSEGSINFFLSEAMFKMFVGTYMVNVFDPQILFNDGFYEHVDVRIPEGTLLKPVKPAALSCRTHALGRIFDVLGGNTGPAGAGLPHRRRFFRQPPPDVLRLRQERRVVPALPDRVRRHPWQAVRRWARRPLAVARIHQRSQRVPRELRSGADGDQRDHFRLRGPRFLPWR